ncbi:MAG TPA: YraN family protein [Deltaproteobacteria bacterium]|nr:YraN family protein [Deltaproteobacteria bacterium]
MNTISTKKTGKTGEVIALSHLKNNGYKIIDRNYTCSIGEIDIVAVNEGDVVFIEVKSRRSEHFGNPSEAVDINKQKKISRVALFYMKEKNLLGCSARFDVVAVMLVPGKPVVEVFQNAFEFAQ